MSNERKGMSMSDVSMTGDTTVPTKYAHLPASEARERIAREELEAVELRKKHEEAMIQRKIEEGVKLALESEAPKEPALKLRAPEPRKVEYVEDCASAPEPTPAPVLMTEGFSNLELASLTNKLFSLASQGGIELKHVGSDSIHAILDNVSIVITKG